MRKFWAAVPLCVMLFLASASAEAAFPDLPETHWAWDSVEKMCADGRVNGYPDGEFKPDNEVTRWEFVKMSGGDPETAQEPERPATRDEAAELLWERAGRPAGTAPSAVTGDSRTPEAVAWAYSRGVMQGDDGLNLRLDGTLTRAEAAALIVRAERKDLPAADFNATVDPVIPERIWNSVQSDIPYAADRGITNGYLCRLALQIGYETQNPTYRTLKKQPEFSGAFAKDLQQVCEECLGEEKATEAFMKQPAKLQDAVAVLSFYAMKQAAESLRFSPDQNYPDAELEAPMAKMGLQFARHNGLFLFADGSLHAEQSASMRDLACILLQLDDITGLTKSQGTVHATRFLKQAAPWPENAVDYAYILEEIPVSVYETPMTQAGIPADSLEFARSFGTTLVDFLNRISQRFPQSVKAEWTFWPSQVTEGADETVLRAGLTISENPEGLTLNQLLPQNNFTETYVGKSFIVDISTGAPVMDVVVDTKDYCALRAFAGKE